MRLQRSQRSSDEGKVTHRGKVGHAICHHVAHLPTAAESPMKGSLQGKAAIIEKSTTTITCGVVLVESLHQSWIPTVVRSFR